MTSRAIIDPATELQNARISSTGQLQFTSQDDLDRAWDLGIFYLKVPDELDMAAARQFGRELARPASPYRDTPKYGDFEGFIALENNQQTKLALRRHHWDQHYPDYIAEFGRQLDEIGVIVISEVLREAGIPESCWSKASGGYSAGAGTAFLNFVHYDTTHPNQGLRPHTDYGFVTILDITAPGLQIQVDGEFVDVPVKPGHLAIHFGEALSFITCYSRRQVGAVVHRVVSQKPEDPLRHGIVYFANPDLDGMLWQFDATGEVKGSSSVANLFQNLERRLTQDS
jgi:isopenicillin N synthase-like dioxygenase